MKQMDKMDTITRGIVHSLPVLVAALILLILMRLSGCAVGFRIESMIH